MKKNKNTAIVMRSSLQEELSDLVSVRRFSFFENKNMSLNVSIIRLNGGFNARRLQRQPEKSNIVTGIVELLNSDLLWTLTLDQDPSFSDVDTWCLFAPESSSIGKDAKDALIKNILPELASCAFVISGREVLIGVVSFVTIREMELVCDSTSSVCQEEGLSALGVLSIATSKFERYLCIFFSWYLF